MFQSAYRQNHSTETALLKVMNDTLLNMNDECVTLLILLDFSAAFDSRAPRARKARARAEPHILVNLPNPENLVIT